MSISLYELHGQEEANHHPLCTCDECNDRLGPPLIEDERADSFFGFATDDDDALSETI